MCRGMCSRSQTPPPKVEYLHLDTHPGTLPESSDAVLLLLLSVDQRKKRLENPSETMCNRVSVGPCCWAMQQFMPWL